MPSLEELRAADSAEGIECLRTMQMKYASILQRLPRVQHEVATWLATSEINHRELAQRIESQMTTVENWLSDYDLLNSTIRNSMEIQNFMSRACKIITLGTSKMIFDEYKIVKTNQLQLEHKQQVKSEREAYRSMVVNKEKEILGKRR